MSQLRVAACATVNCDIKFEAQRGTWGSCWLLVICLCPLVLAIPLRRMGPRDEFRAESDSTYRHCGTIYLGPE